MVPPSLFTLCYLCMKSFAIIAQSNYLVLPPSGFSNEENIKHRLVVIFRPVRLCCLFDSSVSVGFRIAPTRFFRRVLQVTNSNFSLQIFAWHTLRTDALLGNIICKFSCGLSITNGWYFLIHISTHFCSIIRSYSQSVWNFDVASAWRLRCVWLSLSIITVQLGGRGFESLWWLIPSLSSPLLTPTRFLKGDLPHRFIKEGRKK